jgi:hypothetical protein
MLFLILTSIFAILMIWRLKMNGLDTVAVILIFFAIFFLFYSLNYRTLIIRLTSKAIKLTFGIFTWTVPYENVADCRLDDLPTMMRQGGAGIHFMTVDHRYRASFNFLEYPRVVIALKEKAGLVRDVSFSTRRPEEVILLIKGHLLVE